MVSLLTDAIDLGNYGGTPQDRVRIIMRGINEMLRSPSSFNDAGQLLAHKDTLEQSN